jgi:hypothetical protein
MDQLYGPDQVQIMYEVSFFLLLGMLILLQIGVVLVGLSIGYRRGFQVGKKDGEMR